MKNIRKWCSKDNGDMHLLCSVVFELRYTRNKKRKCLLGLLKDANQVPKGFKKWYMQRNKKKLNASKWDWSASEKNIWQFVKEKLVSRIDHELLNKGAVESCGENKSDQLVDQLNWFCI